MAAEYGHQSDSLTGCTNDFPRLRDPHPDGGDAIGVTTSGTGLNHLPPNLEPHRPFEYQYVADPLFPILEPGPVPSSCGFPNLGDRISQTSGLSSNFPAGGLGFGPVPGLNNFFVPAREPPDISAPTALPPSLTNIHGYYCATFGGFDSGDVSQMPANSGISYTPGDELSNFGFLGEASASAGASFSACPFAPPRFDEQQSNRLDTNPTPPQSARVNDNSALPSHSNPSYPSLSRPSLHISTTPRPSNCGREPTSDDYFSTLLNGDFSSPSLPPLSSSPSRSQPLTATQQHQSSNDIISSSLIYANMPSRGESGVVATAASRRSRRGSTASMVDLTSPKAARERTSSSSIDPTTPMAPPPTRKRARPNTSTTQASSRRPSMSAKSRPIKPLPTKRRSTKHEDDVFDDSSSIIGAGDDDVLDLTGADAVPAELLKPKPDNRVKLSKFQCSICMDSVSGLTVTHCGHMFCSECLHSALHIDHMKRTCPICRQKVEIKARPGQKQAKNTFFHLELKLMTANRKGKRPVGQ